VTPEEQRGIASPSAVLLALGFLLIALGVLADTRYKIHLIALISVRL
jgi:hypothetical protein